VLTDPEDIQTDLLRERDLVEQITQAIRAADREGGVRVRSGEAVDSDFHVTGPRVEDRS
jgi:hypothetical protein